MNQTALFDREDFPPASRTSDPASSHQAEHGVTASGQRGTHMELVLGAMKRQGKPMTAREIGCLVPLDNVEITRRLNDLVKRDQAVKGEMKKCSVLGKRVSTWQATTNNRSAS
jgi:hypothetical protein